MYQSSTPKEKEAVAHWLDLVFIYDIFQPTSLYHGTKNAVLVSTDGLLDDHV